MVLAYQNLESAAGTYEFSTIALYIAKKIFCILKLELQKFPFH